MPFLVSKLFRGVLLGAVATLPMITGCGDPEAGTFNAAASEKAAAEKGITGPGPGAKQTPVKPSVVKTKGGFVPREPGGGSARPD